MAAEDHLDRETSVSAEITPTGVTAAARSRSVAAFDRLLGNVFELGNVRLEAGISRKRATIEGERQLIEAAARYGVDRMGRDPEFVERALAGHLEGVLGKQENKDQVVRAAIEDLRREPPSEEDAASGPEKLDDAFSSRFEHYAEGATTEHLQERWGRVLASEIRKPGTFSPKVLRVVDELIPATAKLFEQFAQHRWERGVLECFLPEPLSFQTKQTLVDAGLLVEPGFTGHQRQFVDLTGPNGEAQWAVSCGDRILGLRKDSLPDIIDGPDKVLQISKKGDAPYVPAYLLTDAGFAISTILPPVEDENFTRYGILLAEALPDVPMSHFRRVGKTQRFALVGSINEKP